jgi:hypothetical protein
VAAVRLPVVAVAVLRARRHERSAAAPCSAVVPLARPLRWAVTVARLAQRPVPAVRVRPAAVALAELPEVQVASQAVVQRQPVPVARARALAAPVRAPVVARVEEAAAPVVLVAALVVQAGLEAAAWVPERAGSLPQDSAAILGRPRAARPAAVVASGQTWQRQPAVRPAA